MSSIVGPQFSNIADYDCFIQISFDDVEDFVRLKADPYFMQKCTPDHENFADTKRSQYVSLQIWAGVCRLTAIRMTIGLVHNLVMDGQIV